MPGRAGTQTSLDRVLHATDENARHIQRIALISCSTTSDTRGRRV